MLKNELKLVISQMKQVIISEYFSVCLIVMPRIHSFEHIYSFKLYEGYIFLALLG